MSTKMIASSDAGGDSAPKGTALEVIHHRDALHAVATWQGLTREERECIQDSKPEIILGLVRLLNRHKKRHKRIALARDILGDDHFISPEDVTARFPHLVYTDEQIAMLDASLPEEGKLWEMKEKCAYVSAPLPFPQHLLKVRAGRRELFHGRRKKGWYADPKHRFAYEDMTSFKWTALSESTVPSNRATFSYGHLPNAAEMAWFLIVFYDVRNIRMFENKLIATSSESYMGSKVALGFKGKCINVVDDEASTFRGALRIEVAPSLSLGAPSLPALK